jgi:hypothetical protein
MKCSSLLVLSASSCSTSNAVMVSASNLVYNAAVCLSALTNSSLTLLLCTFTTTVTAPVPPAAQQAPAAPSVSAQAPEAPAAEAAPSAPSVSAVAPQAPVAGAAPAAPSVAQSN